MTPKESPNSATDERISFIMERIASDPHNAEWYFALGNCFEERREDDRALACYGKSLELSPGDYRTLNNMGKCSWRLGRFDEAAASFREATALAPEDTGPFFNLVAMLEDNGRMEEMAAGVLANRAALKVHPDFPELHGIFDGLERDFPPFCRTVFRLEGWLRCLEGYTLSMLAADGGGSGEIVEIGSWMGKSTYCLASGSRRKQRERVTAVDHFQGSPENQEEPVIREEGTTFRRFRQNIEAMGVADRVDPIVAPSEQAVRGWNRPIRLLFIDGDHSYEASKRDFECWSPFVHQDGLIAFHDVDASEGVSAFYRELLAGPDNFVEVTAVLSLRVVGRRSSR